MIVTLGTAQITGSGTTYMSKGTIHIAKAVVAPGTDTDGDLQQTIDALGNEFRVTLA